MFTVFHVESGKDNISPCLKRSQGQAAEDAQTSEIKLCVRIGGESVVVVQTRLIGRVQPSLIGLPQMEESYTFIRNIDTKQQLVVLLTNLPAPIKAKRENCGSSSSKRGDVSFVHKRVGTPFREEVKALLSLTKTE